MVLDDSVLFETLPGAQGELGLITLNRPHVLNSLTLSMVKAMHDKLQEWAQADHIKAVLIKAQPGRAFCAGGDLRSIYEAVKNHDPDPAHFFRDEYQLNRLIFHFPKPYIALLDGITMGGGVGISIHGSHRIATENLLFAMPETGIGFFPDVGGTFFLPRLPGKLGFYLGLTGARLGVDDCVALGIAHHKVLSNNMSALITALVNSPLTPDPYTAVSRIIETFQVSHGPSILLAEQVAIDTCFSAMQMEMIDEKLRQSSSTLCQEAVALLKKKSPTSLKVTLRALQVGAMQDFEACMMQEYGLASHFLQEHDFIEGIRALIIDKDQKPQWLPSVLAEVNAVMLDAYFQENKLIKSSC